MSLSTTCALCSTACPDDHTLISTEGPPTYGGDADDVTIGDACFPCGRTCEEIWALLAAKQVPAQIEEEHDGKA